MNSLNFFLETRNNNWNLIRFGAACGVFLSHCFPLAGFGAGGKPQLLGFISLNAFFIISGLLVTKSYFERSSSLDYLRSRMLRVFPALIVAVLFSVFIVGLAFTNLPTSTYLQQSAVYEYLIKHIILFAANTPEQLPGVFLDSQYKPIVNAPLWSLTYEFTCYLALMIIAFLTAAKNNINFFKVVTLISFLALFSVFIINYVQGADEYAYVLGKDAYRLGAMFLIGVLLYLFREQVLISHWLLAGVVVALMLSVLYRPLLLTLAYASFGYVLLYLAYIPTGKILAFNKLGDYSYGIYIFGYPIQQGLEQVAPDLSLVTFSVVSFSITLSLAILSWHFIEKRALNYK